MNQMTEEECYEMVETSLEHPNLEILQIAERVKRDGDNEEEGGGGGGRRAADVKSSTKLSICKGIQIRLT
jgi:hypothetical protein